MNALPKSSALPLSRTTESETLREAIRQARTEASEQTDAIDDMRAAERVRLELLRDSLSPIFAQVPGEMDIFDHGLAEGDRPRFFVDVVAYVQMGRDRRQYRFVQDTRAGPILLAENEKIEPIVEAVTAYVGRRIVEREKALAAPADPARPSPAAPSETIASALAALPVSPASLGVRRWPAVLAFLLGMLVGAGGLLGYALWRTAPGGPAFSATTP